MADLPARIKLLEEELAVKDERILQLEEELGLEIEAPLFFELTQQEAICFGILMKRKMCLMSTFMTGLYGNAAADADVPEPKIVDVFICKLRKKLQRFDVAIETVWGEGYYFTEENKTRVRTLIEENAA